MHRPPWIAAVVGVIAPILCLSLWSCRSGAPPDPPPVIEFDEGAVRPLPEDAEPAEPMEHIEVKPPPAFLAAPGTAELTIRGPVKKLIDAREQSAQEAVKVTVTGASGPVELDATLELKGRFRFSWCRYPPLGLDIKSETEGTPLEGIKDIKIYPHCDRFPMPPDPDKLIERFMGNESVPARELFSYDIWRIVSGRGHAVRLAEIRYHDPEGDLDLRKPALLSETHGDLADRYKAVRLREDDRPWHYKSRPFEAEPRSTALMQLFQVLLGNHDWTFFDLNERPRWRMRAGYLEEREDPILLSPSNIIVLALPDDLLVAEPYDFDLAPMTIGYPENRSDPNLAVTLFIEKDVDWKDGFLDAQGRFRPKHAREDIDWAIGVFMDKRAAIEKALETSSMDEEGKEIARRRLNNFYELISPEIFYRETIAKPGVQLFSDKDLTQVLCEELSPGIILRSDETEGGATKIRIMDGHRRACRDDKKRTHKVGWVPSDALSADFPPRRAELH